MITKKRSSSNKTCPLLKIIVTALPVLPVTSPSNKCAPESLSTWQIFQCENKLLCFWVDFSFNIKIFLDHYTIPNFKRCTVRLMLLWTLSLSDFFDLFIIPGLKPSGCTARAKAVHFALDSTYSWSSTWLPPAPWPPRPHCRRLKMPS